MAEPEPPPAPLEYSQLKAVSFDVSIADFEGLETEHHLARLLALPRSTQLAVFDELHDIMAENRERRYKSGPVMLDIMTHANVVQYEYGKKWRSVYPEFTKAELQSKTETRNMISCMNRMTELLGIEFIRDLQRLHLVFYSNYGLQNVRSAANKH